MVAARISNLKESRYRAEKSGEIDSYTERDYYGMKALTMVLNQLFGGNGKEASNKNGGAKNIADRGR